MDKCDRKSIGKLLQGLLYRFGRRLAQICLNVSGNDKKYSIAQKQYISKPLTQRGLPWGDHFNEVANVVIGQKRTLMSRQRLFVLWQCVRNTLAISGDVAEIGVFKGGSCYFIASAYATLRSPPITLHAIDTFEGHAVGTITDRDSYHKAGMFSETDVNAVRDYLSSFEFIKVHKGEFNAVAPLLDSQHYRLVHIDTDLYQPTLDCFSYFLPKLSPGGIFVIDDYMGKKCPGVTKAVHEFLDAHPQFEFWFFQTEQAVLAYRG